MGKNQSRPITKPKAIRIEIEKVDDELLTSKIMKRPFKYYSRASGITFGLVFVTNFITSLFDSNTFSILCSKGSLAIIGPIFCKSCWLGALWPHALMKLFFNPLNLFILGGGWLR